MLRCFTLKAPRVGVLGSGTKLKYAANHPVAIHSVACAEMTLLDACASLYTAAMAQGHGEHDTASVAEVLRSMSGETERPNLGRKTR